ncbi:bifunctional folylpolyglutamate synthase/dihydrofolate synthase [Promicromonospora thailandica]|uniref:Dihydrofolate synthase/folylpolyglutamate synthase n=1 Tax=Promicromonospora thailandica TaxID=765201 RepID=A0A9X2G1Q0_9MICO|nr:folylpolyglutamate synthase/dihydrofolate synthase family protein [Promicromonospora thailandica]MCP2263803.1 dihydrofolate synthase / folylpolyglutamate synthase [Promicromonospora thailandica]BFF17908.1 folylpolyglutamate synthase/dihydrofolate synthase family protein [Promicromonospora thailandica]
MTRVQRVLELLGDPHRAYRTVHVTGTNGKSSTARMVERLVREHGLRTGLFTSPHMVSYTERIAVDGEPLSTERFVEVFEDVAPYIGVADRESQEAGGPRLSFFEVLTVMAFAAFADAPVDVAVIEVGMGGRWDSTNVVDGEVAVITPVALDHERWLGSTIAEIATEKAGIIKDGANAVIAEQPDAALEPILARAEKVGAHLIREGIDLEVVDRRVAVGGQLVDLRTPAGVYTEIFVPLHGAHQARNALLALAATESLISGGRALGAEIVEAGFAGVEVPGRLELVRSSPTVLVDVAHNPAGAEALVDALEESFNLQHLVAVVAVMADKDAEGLLAVLEPTVAEIVVTRNSSDRSADPEDLAEVAREVFGDDRVHVADRLDEALQLATDLAEAGDRHGSGVGTGVLVTGSVVTVADTRILVGRA